MLQSPRGTRDLISDTLLTYQGVVDVARRLSHQYGFHDIETPILELASVFCHMGDSSDVVTKQTYTFKDRGNQELTMRPEGTAGVMRAILSNGLTQSTPLKLCYYGPMFRYERPQKGRYRQFHQFGVELVGVPQAQADVEVIAMANQFLQDLNLRGKTTLEINTLGDDQSRDNYRAALVDYLTGHKDKLSADSQTRLQVNPLRILDSKDEGDQVLLKDAPVYRDYLNEASEQFFSQVLEGLDALGIPYKLNYQIVRGLDYYCHTAFEFVTDALGAQSAVLAGGRYDGLIKQMGGPELPGVGWAAGVDRLVELTQLQFAPKRPVTVIPMGEAAEKEALILTTDLRNKGFVMDLGYSGSMSKRMKKAHKNNACAVLILGDEELASGMVQVKNLDSGEQKTVARADLQNVLKGVIAK